MHAMSPLTVLSHVHITLGLPLSTTHYDAVSIFTRNSAEKKVHGMQTHLF